MSYEENKKSKVSGNPSEDSTTRREWAIVWKAAAESDEGQFGHVEVTADLQKGNFSGVVGGKAQTVGVREWLKGEEVEKLCIDYSFEEFFALKRGREMGKWDGKYSRLKVFFFFFF